MSGFADEAMVDLMGSLMRKGGAHALLAYLAARVPHRYTALYRACGDRLRSVVLLDKLGIHPIFLQDVPMDESYCKYAIRDGSFLTDDARVDTRLKGHPLQQLVVSYFSVPVFGVDGAVWGTVSHFDTECRKLPDHEFELLRAAAAVLKADLLEPRSVKAATSRPFVSGASGASGAA